MTPWWHSVEKTRQGMGSEVVVARGVGSGRRARGQEEAQRELVAVAEHMRGEREALGCASAG